MADSEASNSSIIISNSSEDTIVAHGDTDDANTSYSPLVFDIIKRDIAVEGRGSLTTKELFPMKPCLEERRSQHWLALSHDAKASEGRETDARSFYQKQHQVKKSRRGPRSRSSQYRGVTFYRRTGRWESHIWDCGKQVYLGGFDTAHAAARAYDRAAIRFRGIDADINFSLTDYDDDMKQMRSLSKEEFVHILRRQSTGFARGNSKIKAASLQKSAGWEGLRSAAAAIEYNSQNLDLRLGISLPQYETVTSSSPVQALHGLPLTRQSVPTWPGAAPNGQERGRMELLPWWPRGTQSRVSLVDVPPAASSGFSRFVSSSAAAVSDPLNPLARLPLHFYSASSSFDRNQ